MTTLINLSVYVSLFPCRPKVDKQYSRDMFVFLFFLLVFTAFVFTIKSTKDKLLNRDQTEEWKGWMQVLHWHYWYHVTDTDNVPFLYTPQIPENLYFSFASRGYRKEIFAQNRLMKSHSIWINFFWQEIIFSHKTSKERKEKQGYKSYDLSCVARCFKELVGGGRGFGVEFIFGMPNLLHCSSKNWEKLEENRSLYVLDYVQPKVFIEYHPCKNCEYIMHFTEYRAI